jgi:hypothetical protein
MTFLSHFSCGQKVANEVDELSPFQEIHAVTGIEARLASQLFKLSMTDNI